MLGFLLASWVLILIPGPDQALITRNALRHSRRAGFSTMQRATGGLLLAFGARLAFDRR